MLHKNHNNDLHNITLSRGTTTVRSNDTLVDTPFQLISGFFHVNQGVLCSEHAEQASSRGVLGATGLLNKGGGATGFLWNFHRYRLVIMISLI